MQLVDMGHGHGLQTWLADMGCGHGWQTWLVNVVHKIWSMNPVCKHGVIVMTFLVRPWNGLTFFKLF